MKFSIITACYNSANTIADTLQSVSAQKNVKVEHILVDGASSDSTLQIIKRHPDSVILVSELDEGIYDAMNKGIKLANGDIIGTLNADDFYMNDHVLEDVAQVFLDPTVEACYGDLVYVRQDYVEQVVRFWKSAPFKSGLFKLGWMPAHPTFFVRSDVYNRLGVFDLNFKLAADFELLFRFIEENRIETRYISKVLVKMRLGGASNKSLTNVMIQNKEILFILRSYYADFSVLRFLVSKAFNRILQFYYGYKFRFFG